MYATYMHAHCILSRKHSSAILHCAIVRLIFSKCCCSTCAGDGAGVANACCNSSDRVRTAPATRITGEAEGMHTGGGGGMGGGLGAL